MKVLDKLATTLPDSRNFFVSYVMLAGLAIVPLQLLELATVIPRMFYQLFLTRTPRGESSHLNGHLHSISEPTLTLRPCDVQITPP